MSDSKGRKTDDATFQNDDGRITLCRKLRRKFEGKKYESLKRAETRPGGTRSTSDDKKRGH